MKIAITESFLDDLAQLPSGVSSKCRQLVRELRRTAAGDLLRNALPGWRLHKLQSSPFRSLSVDMKYRVLAKLEGDTLFVHRVVKHDLADSPTINRNDREEALGEVAAFQMSIREAVSALEALGMPQEHLDPLRHLTNEDQLLDSLTNIPAEWANTALDLVELAGLRIPKAKFHIFEADSAFEDLLNRPFEEWQIYLHPAQKHIVEFLGILGPSFRGQRVQERPFVRGTGSKCSALKAIL